MLPMEKAEGRLYAYACHDSNLSMVGILGGARHQEKEAAGAADNMKKDE